jgi:V8-like Glu-specific endopeptidase
VPRPKCPEIERPSSGLTLLFTFSADHQKMRLSVAVIAAGLLALSEVSSASLTDIFGFQICRPPPTPRVLQINATRLAQIVKPFMPPFINGRANISSFKPRYLNFTRLPEKQLFRDPHLGQFLQIAPNSTFLFEREQLLQVSLTSYPYTTMGKVFVTDGAQGSTCSGASVGPNLVLTADHCIPWNSTSWSLQFVPAFDATAPNPQPFGSAYATQCVGIVPALLDGRDYAVCQLDQPIGLTTIGWLGWQASTDNAFYLGNTWSSVGYPYTFMNGGVAASQDGIVIDTVADTGDDGKILSSTPYVEQGWSGGPLFGWTGDDPYIIGVVSAVLGNSFYDGIFATATFHAAGVRLAELVQFGLTQWHI